MSKLMGVGLVSPLLKIGEEEIGPMGHRNLWKLCIVFFSGIQHSRVYPAVVLLPEVLKIKRRIHATRKMKCMKLQCLSAETAI